MNLTYNPRFNRAYEDIIKKLDLCGIIPLVVIDNIKNALPLAGALLGADIRVMEITFRTNAAEDAIRIITSKCPDITVGAGTVISTKQVKAAVAAGAQYIVTPGFNAEVVDFCLDLGIPVFPGCSNGTDIESAISRGLKAVKFFPAELLGGIEMMKALSGPYPFMKFMPTGGINPENLSHYLSFNRVLCCGGTFIADEDDLKNERFNAITLNARNAVNAVIELKLDHIALNTDAKGAAEILKGFSRLSGQNYDPSANCVFGMEAVKNSDRKAVGHIVYSSPNLERCIYYLKNRGFEIDESTVQKESNCITEVFLLGNFGGFEIKLIKRR